MSELSIQNSLTIKPIHNNLPNQQQQSHQSPKSKLWLQYSQPNLKTFKSNELSWKGNSQYIDLSNNLNEARNSQQSSQFKSNIHKKLKYEQSSKEGEQKVVENKSKKLEGLEATKQPMGRTKYDRNQVKLHLKVGKSDYQGRDVGKMEKKCDLKLDKTYKQKEYCYCALM